MPTSPVHAKEVSINSSASLVNIVESDASKLYSLREIACSALVGILVLNGVAVTPGDGLQVRVHLIRLFCPTKKNIDINIDL